MTKGLLYTVFGEQYDLLAAHTISYSRQFTDLPVHVLTNIPAPKRHVKWNEVNNVSFTFLDVTQDDNRAIKTQMNKYTPFDETLYIDCDCLIQKKGAEEVFELMKDKDLMLSVYYHDWIKGHQVLAIAKRVMEIAEETLPMMIYCGGFIGFKKNPRTNTFFYLWHELWKATGMGREMFEMCCVAKMLKMKIAEVWDDPSKSSKDKKYIFAAMHKDERVIFQHLYNTGKESWCKDFGMPEIVPYKPFDRTAHKDFVWVDMENKDNV